MPVTNSATQYLGLAHRCRGQLRTGGMLRLLQRNFTVWCWQCSEDNFFWINWPFNLALTWDLKRVLVINRDINAQSLLGKGLKLKHLYASQSIKIIKNITMYHEPHQGSAIKNLSTCRTPGVGWSSFRYRTDHSFEQLQTRLLQELAPLGTFWQYFDRVVRHFNRPCWTCMSKNVTGMKAVCRKMFCHFSDVQSTFI